MYQLNMALSAAKVPFHICIQQLNYYKKGNRSGLIAHTGTRYMELLHHRKLVLQVARESEKDIYDVTGDLREH